MDGKIWFSVSYKLKQPKPKGPPPPFEFKLDLPPDGAEVPYVKNYEPPPPEPEPVLVPEGTEPTAEGDSNKEYTIVIHIVYNNAARNNLIHKPTSNDFLSVWSLTNSKSGILGSC